MNICPFCERNNRDDAAICHHCGRGLSRLTGLSTLLLHEKGATGGLSDQGSNCFTPNMSVILRFREAREAMTLPLNGETILGRVSPSRATRQPDIDLSYFKAYEQGVSSRHAALNRSDDRLIMTDLGSTNGTFRNDERLLPYQPTVIYSGDEILLGNLPVVFYFQETAPAH